MAEQTVDELEVEEGTPFGEIVAEGVSAEDYMEHYAASHHEWVRGFVVKISPISLPHYEIVLYLTILFKTYFQINPIGRVVGDPFVLQMDAVQSRRQPDLQIILNTNPGQLTDTAMLGPADICIEVVSPGSVIIDYGEKFAEYEKGGVREYWLLDAIWQDLPFQPPERERTL